MEKAGRKQREDFAMTETKYIFPKQMQSVAALVFIAVLIVLLLILTVMVHMRNRKLKSTLEEQIAERRLLDKICADFTAVYYVELNTGFFEILHMNDGTNAKNESETVVIISIMLLTNMRFSICMKKREKNLKTGFRRGI